MLKEQQELEELKSKSAAKAELQPKLDQEAREKAASIRTADGRSMSAADVQKQANAIDGAVIPNVLWDDEKPSDFISDCREEISLRRIVQRAMNCNWKMQSPKQLDFAFHQLAMDEDARATM